MPKIVTQEEVIARFKSVHGDRYDYSKVEYKGMHSKVCIICPVHGEFWQTPNDHLSGKGCHKCGGTYKLTTEDFIRRAREVHGDKYDYSKVEYKNSWTKVCIICPIHGEFWQNPLSHLKGFGCSKCAGLYKRTTEEFIAEAREIHGNFFDYSKVDYKNSQTKVCIICPIHGEFWQTPNAHLAGKGCAKCACEKTHAMFRKSTEQFIAEARAVWGDKFDYSKVDYRKNDIKVCIICPEHGEFWVSPINHLKEKDCPKCARIHAANLRRCSNEDFIQRLCKIFGDKYGFEKTEYKDNRTRVLITCPIHGDVYAFPSRLLQGYGCPLCRESQGEKKVAEWLDAHNIDYHRQYRINPTKVLFGRNRFYIDFYIPIYNLFIEYNGEQHYKNVPHFDKGDTFAIQQDRDRRLREYCKQNKIRLIEIPYTEFDNIDKILSKKIKVKP